MADIPHFHICPECDDEFECVDVDCMQHNDILCDDCEYDHLDDEDDNDEIEDDDD